MYYIENLAIIYIECLHISYLRRNSQYWSIEINKYIASWICLTDWLTRVFTLLCPPKNVILSLFRWTLTFAKAFSNWQCQYYCPESWQPGKRRRSGWLWVCEWNKVRSPGQFVCMFSNSQDIKFLLLSLQPASQYWKRPRK